MQFFLMKVFSLPRNDELAAARARLSPLALFHMAIKATLGVDLLIAFGALAIGQGHHCFVPFDCAGAIQAFHHAVIMVIRSQTSPKAIQTTFGMAAPPMFDPPANHLKTFLAEMSILVHQFWSQNYF